MDSGWGNQSRPRTGEIRTPAHTCIWPEDIRGRKTRESGTAAHAEKLEDLTIVCAHRGLCYAFSESSSICNDWFAKFDESGLALLVQDETASGERSNFNKLVSRETAGVAEGMDGRAAREAAHRRMRRSTKRQSRNLMKKMKKIRISAAQI